MAIPIDPRPLSPAERAVLTRILTEDFEGHEALLAQLDAAEVTAVWGPGSVSVDLCVSGVRATTGPSGPVPVRAVVNESGAPMGELLVWLDKGVLAGLEFAWYGDRMPTELPAPEAIAIE